ncbi:MAG: hypothetical protein ACLPXB_19120, partial [Thiobacillaceae bacterium]
QANVSTPIMAAVGQLCREIKASIPGVRLILTGWHPSALPERTLREEACDMLIQGEGFYALADVLAGRRFPEIRGLWWKERPSQMKTRTTPKIVENPSMRAIVSKFVFMLIFLHQQKYFQFIWVGIMPG